MQIFKSSWFQRFAKKEGIADAALQEAADRAGKGQIDADLGGEVIKQRIARRGQGRSRGYRTIILFRRGTKAFFVYGFPKSQRANIDADELKQFREAAKHVLALTERQLAELLKRGDFIEVKEEWSRNTEVKRWRPSMKPWRPCMMSALSTSGLCVASMLPA